MRTLARVLCAVGVVAALALPAEAQTFDTVGARAAGMGGAFVAVADDASAAYWNPAGFAAGSYFSLVLDRNTAELDPPPNGAAASRSGFLIALGMPALGLSYYRLRSTALRPIPSAGPAPSVVQADTLITHHTGATLVQSVGRVLAVGATLKLVRGYASTAVAPEASRDDLLDGETPSSEGSTHFDADLGVLASIGRLKAGLTVRNLTEPSFRGDLAPAALKLERQARAGVSLRPVANWVVAADVDVLESNGPLGRTRTFATGTEGRILKRAFVRGGFHVNTSSGVSAPTGSVGASFAATAAVFIDAQATGGSDRATRGWGVAARFVY
jgi:hypothetical protein